GSGMIAPDMATMLAFVATDAPVDASALQRWLAAGTKVSFNAITVDSDTSTSDTLMAFATGEAGGPPLTDDPADHDGAQFADALADLLFDLAMQTVKDGEGLTKFVRIEVTGAENEQAADAIARAIADSPLVKTAIAGEDPNWGRIVMAVGKAGERADRDALAIRFGDIEVAKRGEVSPTYREVDGAAYMKRDEIDIHVDVGIGTGAAVVYTCDLTHDYIAINADYRS
ncbi:MAG: bifunctional ornithine acetyltransferase/N-acetylglutamate synthase, partial [Pseudomonadota bacterium]